MPSHLMSFEFGDLHYTQQMNGKECTLLFLHAFHSSADSFQQVSHLLADRYNIICLDLPGHALSAHLDCDSHAWTYSMEGFTAVVKEFIERLQLKNYVIVGDSVGGNCAVRAMNQLTGLSGVVLMGTAQARSVEMIFSLHHQSESLDLLFQKERTLEQDEVVARSYVDPDKNEGKAFDLMLRDIRKTDPNCRERFASQMGSQPWIDELEVLQNTKIPFMYILGENDGFINSPHYRDVLIEAGVKPAQIHLLEGVRHVPHLDAPETTADLISKFVEGV